MARPKRLLASWARIIREPLSEYETKVLTDTQLTSPAAVFSLLKERVAREEQECLVKSRVVCKSI